MRFGRNLAAIVSRWRQSQSGNIAIISGLALPALVGFCGLGVDAGYWYFRQRDLQGAVDITAYNATVALRSGATTTAITYGASGDAALNGWNPGQGTIVVHTPPTSGTHQTTNAVEVILTETEPRFFSAIFTSTPVNASVRAVGSYASSGVACLLALNRTAHKALQFWGNNTAVMNGCNVMSDSFASDGIGIGGSSTLTVPCAISAGGVAVSSTLNLTSCVHPLTNAPVAADPYASLAAPPIPATCQTVPPSSTLSPGKYCGGLSIHDTRTLSPGVYVISGGTLSLNANANISGSGVMFYLTGGATVQINGGAHLNLSAATTGTYAGMLFYGDRNDPNATQSFNGDASSLMTGAIYFPTQKVQMNGNFGGNNGCMQVVADTIDYSGSTTLSATCPGTGMSGIPVPGGITLVE